jgi:hypothetical protein
VTPQKRRTIPPRPQSGAAEPRLRVAETSPRPAAKSRAKAEGWGIGAALRRWREARKARERESFAAAVQAALHEMSGAGTYRYDAETFELVESESGTRTELASSFDRYIEAEPEVRSDTIAALARRALVPPIPREFERARGGLGLELRSRALHELERLAHPGNDALVLPLATTLLARLHYAGQQRKHPCAQSNLKDWGRSHEEVFGAALYNLTCGAPDKLIEGPPGVYLSPPSHPAGSTLMCAEKLLRAAPLRGDPVIMVPTRSLLLVAGSDDPSGLAAMADFAWRALPGDRPVSGTALRLTERGWKRFQAGEGSLHARLRRIEIPIELQEFAEQRALLEALQLKSRESLHVTAAELALDECGNPRTVARWIEGVEALLPCTERLVLTRVGPRPERLSVDFSTALEEAGRWMEATDLYPARFRVHGFPSSDELRALARRPDCVIERG